MPTDLAPHNLTSDTSNPPYVVTESPSYATYLGFKAFDGTPAPWLGSVCPTWKLSIDLGYTQILGSYALAVTMATVGTVARCPTTWEMQGSTDNATWVTVDTQTGITWNGTEGQTQTFVLATAAEYRYFRIYITANGGDSYSEISELNLYQGVATGTTPQTITFPSIAGQTTGTPFTLSATSDSGLSVSYAVTSGSASVSGSTVTPTSVGSVTIEASQVGDGTYAPATPVDQSFTVTTMFSPSTLTSNTSLAPFVASTSDGESAAWTAFDGNTGSFGGCYPPVPGGWLQLDTGALFILTSYAIYCGDGNPYRGPYVWTVSGSTDSTTWTILDNRTGSQSPWSYGVPQTFVIASPGTISYRFFRITVSAEVGDGIGGSGNAEFDQWQLFGTPDGVVTIPQSSQQQLEFVVT